MERSVPPIAPGRLHILTRGVPSCAQLAIFLSALTNKLQYKRLYNLRINSVSLSGGVLHIHESIGQKRLSQKRTEFTGAGAGHDIQSLPVPSTLISVVHRRLRAFYSLSSPASPIFIPEEIGIVDRAALRTRFTETHGGTKHCSLVLRSLHTDRTALLVLGNNALHRIVGRLNRTDRGITVGRCRHIITRRRHRVIGLLTSRFLRRTCTRKARASDLRSVIGVARREIHRLAQVVTSFGRTVSRLGLTD